MVTGRRIIKEAKSPVSKRYFWKSIGANSER